MLRPSASAANSSARCEIDLSPGTRSRPRSGRAPPSDELVGQRADGAHASSVRRDVVAELVQPGLERVGAVGRRRRARAHRAPPSSECAISKSATLTPSRPASVVTSASTPGRSGTGMRSSTRSVARPAMPTGRLRRAARARSSSASSAVAVAARRRDRARAASASRYASSASSTASRFAQQDVGPDRRVAGGDARHVAEPAGREPQQRAVLVLVRRSRRPSASTPRAAARDSRPRRARRGARASTATTSAPSSRTQRAHRA